MSQEFDLIIIGAGPGGYVAAIRAAQLGLKTAVVEKEDALGGTCLRIGCIPSKALLESSELYHEATTSFAKHGVLVGEARFDLKAMMKRKDDIVTSLTRGVEGLFKKNGITRLKGHGRLMGEGRVAVLQSGQSISEAPVYSAKNILIATGSKVAMLPGVVPDGKTVITSTEALALDAVPGHLVVIGAGAIGLELGSVWSRLGAKVTVLEYLPRILPGMDGEIAEEARKLLARRGLEFKLGVRVTSAKVDGQGARIEIEGQEPLHCDKVLLAVGRVSNTENLGLEEVGLKVDGRGRIPVNADFETGVKGLYAIGDVIPGAMLAHKAEEEGVACAERIATGHGHVDYNCIPGIVYTSPEVASVGRSEEELHAEGIPVRKGSFPFIANGRAKALGQTEGKVKVIAHEKTDRVLGVHIVGPRAGDLIAEAATAMAFGASAEDLARACHAHPTLSEALKEACLAVGGRVIHL
jgi:dihydrolipoamide dehydrogenase